MLKYEVLLRNEKTRIYRVLNWLIIALNAAGLFYLVLYTADYSRNLAIVALAALGILLAVAYFKKKDEHNTVFNLAFCIIVMAWFFAGYYLPGGINLLLYILQHFALKQSRIYVYMQKIVVPSFTNKEIQWNELNNMMLKDGLLTIDFKNNKLIQQAIDSRLFNVDEKEFNDFCRQRMVLSVEC